MPVLFCLVCPSVCSSLCSGTLTSMGMATSHRKSSRSSVGTSLTSAPLGTSTRTSEESWGLGEWEGRLTSPPCQLPPVQDEATKPDDLGRGSYQCGEGLSSQGRGCRLWRHRVTPLVQMGGLHLKLAKTGLGTEVLLYLWSS